MTTMGEPITWSEADLDRLSTITEADIEAARAFWQASAPAEFQDLLEAQPEEDTDAA